MPPDPVALTLFTADVEARHQRMRWIETQPMQMDGFDGFNGLFFYYYSSISAGAQISPLVGLKIAQRRSY